MKLAFLLFCLCPINLFSKCIVEIGSMFLFPCAGVDMHRGIYLFDASDAFGSDLPDTDVGEARRILNSFLVFLEQASSESLVIAATNHPSILDRALFRRFDMVIGYERPTADEAVAVMKARLGPLGKGIRWATVRDLTAGLSHAELVKAAESAGKRSLLAGDDHVMTTTLVGALKERSDSASA